MPVNILLLFVLEWLLVDFGVDAGPFSTGSSKILWNKNELVSHWGQWQKEVDNYAAADLTGGAEKLLALLITSLLESYCPLGSDAVADHVRVYSCNFCVSKSIFDKQ